MAIRARFPLIAALIVSLALHAVFVWLTGAPEWPAAVRPGELSVSFSIDAGVEPDASPDTPAESPAVQEPLTRASEPPPGFAEDRTIRAPAAEESTPFALPSRTALIDAITATAPAVSTYPVFRTSRTNDPSSHYYLDALARELHRVGQLNYPQAAKRQNLTGSLTIAITIRRDGSLQSTRTVTSSGHALLDRAALDIVRLAAPFSPPPAQMLANSEALEIVHSWQFTRRSS